MTDEQVQRIVDALSGNPWEPWSAALIAVLAAAVGFALSQWAEARNRRRARTERASAERAATVHEAATVAVRSTAAPASVLRAEPDIATADVPAIVISLRSIDRTGAVGNWWFRQMARANAPLPALGSWSAEESTFRAAVGASVLVRLNMWRDGKAEASEFAEENDTHWDAAMNIPETPKSFTRRMRQQS